MLRAVAVILAAALSAGPASAVCPGHQTQIVAGAEGSFRVCPQEVDSGGAKVGPDFYRSCTVNAVWQGGGSAKVIVDAPSPGVPVLVRFPAAYGAGGATAYCTNVQKVDGAVAASAVRFGDLGPPVPPALDPWAGGGQVP